MALTGLDIFKLLPKTNCKKCGMPTCLAFAMALAQKRAKLDDCPDVSQEAKDKLAAAAAPPMQKVVFGTGDGQVQIGQETVPAGFHHTVTTNGGQLLTDIEAAHPGQRDQEATIGRLTEGGDAACTTRAVDGCHFAL